jgi:hypothetical protein
MQTSQMSSKLRQNKFLIKCYGNGKKMDNFINQLKAIEEGKAADLENKHFMEQIDGIVYECGSFKSYNFSKNANNKSTPKYTAKLLSKINPSWSLQIVSTGDCDAYGRWMDVVMCLVVKSLSEEKTCPRCGVIYDKKTSSSCDLCQTCTHARRDERVKEQEAAYEKHINELRKKVEDAKTNPVSIWQQTCRCGVSYEAQTLHEMDYPQGCVDCRKIAAEARCESDSDSDCCECLYNADDGCRCAIRIAIAIKP